MASSKFRTSFNFPSLGSVNWYPGHMAKGVYNMQAALVRCDCVLEVRDARIPFSCTNAKFTKLLAGRPRVLILNKADLSVLSDRKVIKRHNIDQIKNSLAQDEVVLTNSAKQQDSSIRKIIPAALRSMNKYGIIEKKAQQDSDPSKSFFKIMIIGLPNVGKSSVINAIRRFHTKKGKAAPVGGVPGITRAVQTNVKVCDNPKTYLVDTPGIMPTYVRNVEVGLKLALVGTLRDHVVGIELIADFLLYTLNQQQNFSYAEYFNLDEPTDDIDLVLAHIARRIGALRKGGVLDLNQAATRFLSKFRQGHFGTILLDSIQ